MTGLRTTRLTKISPLQAFVCIGVGLLTVFGLFGCGSGAQPENETNSISSPGMNDPVWLTTREKMPPPEADRIEYDAKSRTLTFYDLPARDSWIVKLPDQEFGQFVGSQHRLPEGADLKQTLVYYNRAGVKMSAPVTVAQIEAGRLSHISLASGP
jgi:hypothetical protein